MEHTQQSMLTTEVSGHLSLQASSPQLLYHPRFLQDASRPSWGTQDNRTNSFLPEDAGLQQQSLLGNSP